MKYYKLIYTDSIKDGFGGKADMWKIRILEKYRNDKGLLEHEKFHVRCWWYCLLASWLISTVCLLTGLKGIALLFLVLGPFVHQLIYRNKYFRRMVEAKAYRIQIKEGNYASNEFAIKAMMSKYGFGMSRDEAIKILKL